MPDLTEVADAQRRAILAQEREVSAELVRVYGQAYQTIRAQLKALTDEIEAARERGETVNLGWLAQRDRLESLKGQVETEINRFADTADGLITRQQQTFIFLAREHVEAQALASVSSPSAALQLNFNRLPTGAGQELVGVLADGSPLRALLGQLGPSAAQVVADGLLQGVALGQGTDQIARTIRVGLGGNLARAQSIARTEVIRSYRESSRQTALQNREIISGWYWLAAYSTRSCASCLAASGSFHLLSERLNDHPRGRCVPAGTLVEGPPTLAATTRFYRGELVTIRTALGNELSITPNHPILTPSGWVAAGQLREGDDIFSRRGSQSGVLAEISHHDDHAPSRIEEVAESLGVVASEVPCTPIDFYGDGVGSEVYVVRANRLLRDGDEPAFGQHPLQFNFSRGAVRSSLLTGASHLQPFGHSGDPGLRHGPCMCDSLQMDLVRSGVGKQSIGLFRSANMHSGPFQPGADTGAGNSKFLGQPVFGFTGDIAGDDVFIGKSAHCYPSRTDSVGHSCSNLRRCGCPPSAHVFSMGPNLDSVGNQAFLEPRRINSVLLGQFPHILAGDVSTDRIVHIKRVGYSGHVYDLQTTEGWFSANNVIVHNCTQIFAVRGAPGPDMETGPDWFARQSEEAQAAILGPAKLRAFQDGKITLQDLHGERHSRAWGTSHPERSLRDVLGEKAAREYIQKAMAAA